MSNDTGGPAFPKAGHEWSDMEWVPAPDQTGMTLRDYFAAKAMQGLLSGLESGNEHQVILIPNIAYELADAMLRERKA